MTKRSGLPVYLRGEQAEYVRGLAARTGISAATYVRLAVAHYQQTNHAV